MPFAPDQRLPDSVPLDIGRELSCPTAEEFDGYAARHPQGGMPYGMAPLSDAELGLLAGWAARGCGSRSAKRRPSDSVRPTRDEMP